VWDYHGSSLGYCTFLTFFVIVFCSFTWGGGAGGAGGPGENGGGGRAIKLPGQVIRVILWTTGTFQKDGVESSPLFRKTVQTVSFAYPFDGLLRE